MSDFLAGEKKPKKLLTDNGLEFKNSLLKETVVRYGVELIHGSPYTPTTTRAIERFNATLKGKLKKMSEFGNKEWTIILEEAVESYNLCKSRATGVAPIEMFKGLVLYDKDEGAFYTNRNEKDMQEKARLRVLKYQKEYTNKKGKIISFKIGQNVWYKDPLHSDQGLTPVYTKKGEVVDLQYKSALVKLENGKIVQTHIKRLKPVV